MIFSSIFVVSRVHCFLSFFIILCTYNGQRQDDWVSGWLTWWRSFLELPKLFLRRSCVFHMRFSSEQATCLELSFSTIMESCSPPLFLSFTQDFNESWVQSLISWFVIAIFLRGRTHGCLNFGGWLGDPILCTKYYMNGFFCDTTLFFRLSLCLRWRSPMASLLEWLYPMDRDWLNDKIFISTVHCLLP